MDSLLLNGKAKPRFVKDEFKNWGQTRINVDGGIAIGQIIGSAVGEETMRGIWEAEGAQLQSDLKKQV